MRAEEKGKRVIVIGAGLGGMSAAIMLSRRGFQVTLLEKNQHVGGKLNQLQVGGFSFDLGPSIFTLPQIFRPVFEGDGKRLEDYISLQRLDPQWRNFFEDGIVLDLWEDAERCAPNWLASGQTSLKSTKNSSPIHAVSTKLLKADISAKVWTLLASSFAFTAGAMHGISITCVPCQAASTSA